MQDLKQNPFPSGPGGPLGGPGTQKVFNLLVPPTNIAPAAYIFFSGLFLILRELLPAINPDFSLEKGLSSGLYIILNLSYAALILAFYFETKHRAFLLGGIIALLITVRTISFMLGSPLPIPFASDTFCKITWGVGLLSCRHLVPRHHQGLRILAIFSFAYAGIQFAQSYFLLSEYYTVIRTVISALEFLLYVWVFYKFDFLGLNPSNTKDKPEEQNPTFR